MILVSGDYQRDASRPTTSLASILPADLNVHQGRCCEKMAREEYDDIN